MPPRPVDKGMLVGTHRRRLDEKWRVPVPNELFTDGSGAEAENLYFSPIGDHLIFFPEEYFRKLSAQLLDKSVFAHPDLRRRFYGNTYQKQRDKNGRVQIPEPLRALSGLSTKQDVVLVGTGSYAELIPAGSAPGDPSAADMLEVFKTLEKLGGEA